VLPLSFVVPESPLVSEVPEVELLEDEELELELEELLLEEDEELELELEDEELLDASFAAVASNISSFKVMMGEVEN